MLAVERSSLFRILGVCVVGGCLSGCFGSGRIISVLLLLRCAGGGGGACYGSVDSGDVVSL